MSDQAAQNTDRELWRGPDEGAGAAYADSVHVTVSGAISINCGGFVFVKLARDWHALAMRRDPKWQPIETAPKDGTWVLVWENTGVNTKFSCADVARYNLGEWQNGEKCRVHHASHWMPLPTPPVSP
jgi:hypothetical protein